MTKKRVDWIDMARGYGMLFVIAAHCSIGILGKWMYTFHLPLFFMLSGFLARKILRMETYRGVSPEKNQDHLGAIFSAGNSIGYLPVVGELFYGILRRNGYSIYFSSTSGSEKNVHSLVFGVPVLRANGFLFSGKIHKRFAVDRPGLPEHHPFGLCVLFEWGWQSPLEFRHLVDGDFFLLHRICVQTKEAEHR